PGQQGKGHAAASIKELGPTPQGVGPDGTEPGPVAAQAGGGQKPISRGLASAENRSARRGTGPGGGAFHLFLATGQVAPGASAGGSLFVALQPQRARTGAGVAV